MALFSKKNLNDRYSIGQIDKYSIISVECLEKILNTKLYFYDKENKISPADIDGYVFSIDEFSSVYVKISVSLCAFFKIDKNNKRQWIFFSSGPNTLNFKLYNDARYFTIDYIIRRTDSLKEELEAVDEINK